MWHELSENPQMLSAFYNNVPQLDSVEIHEILLHRDGPLLKVRFEMPIFPDKPPDSWLKQGFNTAQLVVDFWSISDLAIQGWSTTNIGNLRIEKIADLNLLLTIISPDFKLSAKAMFFRCAKITGYIKS
jgi:hypothetical protein